MNISSPWRGILPDDLTPEAHKALWAIIKDVRAVEPDAQSAALLGDFALLFGYVSRVDHSDDWQELAEEYLERSIDKSSGTHAGWLGLYGGLCGVGWAIEHLARLLGGEEEVDETTADPIEVVDRVLIESLSGSGWRGPYDLVSGLVGFGTYFVERLPRESAYRGLKLILRNLTAQCEKSWGGTTWHTPPQLIPSRQLNVAPDGYYNLGVAHGVPGVIKLLSDVVAAGIDEPGIEELLADSVRWLLARERPPQSLSRFSAWFVPGAEGSDSRVSWCYGDLGIAAVLFAVGRQVGRSDWEKSGEELLLRCVEWPAERHGVVDAPLCHGAFGAAHIFNRAYQLTLDERYKRAAIFWFDRGLAFRRPGEGVGGFVFYTPEQNPVWTADYSFLSGGVGIALSLISSMYPVSAAWDRLLLLSDRVGTPRMTRVAA